MDLKANATQSSRSKVAHTNIQQRKNNTSSYNKKYHGRFKKSKLPCPIDVLSKLGIMPKRSNSGGYWELHCPFHKNGSEKHPSLNLHAVDGHFRCHACGEYGGDVLDFYMKVTGLSFISAAKKLGAWGCDK